MKRITVKFIENYPPYQKGETASFFEREASRLCDRGFAMYIGGDDRRDTDADRLRALRGAPSDRSVHGPAETRHVAGPASTRENTPDATGTPPAGNRPSQVEGAGKAGPLCGLCRKPGHNRTNCPEKK